jgi:5-methylcytosine-specific restriction endonuclease McrA
MPTLVRCVDCGRPTVSRPRCQACETKNPTPHGYGHAWTKIRRAYLAAHPECAKCGATAKQLDHVVPLSQGGTHAWTNLQSLCLRCHAVKSKRERRDGLLASQP